MNNNIISYGAARVLNHLAKRPYSIRLDTNNTCNLNCIYCRINDYPHNAEYMSVSQFKRLAEIFFAKSQYVSLSFATEPLMSKHFAFFIEELRKYDVPETHFITNGLLLTDEIIKVCIKSGIHAITVSNDAVNSEIYANIRGKTATGEYRKGSLFEELMSKLARIDQLKKEANSLMPLIRIQFTVFSYNKNEAVPFINAHHSYFQEFYMTHLSPMYLGTYQDEKLKRLDKWEFLQLKDEVIAATIQHGIRSKTTYNDLTRRRAGNVWCTFPLSNRFIYSNGDMMMCDKQLYGNIFKESLADIEGRIKDAFRRYNPNCSLKCTQPIAKEKEI